MLGGLSIATLVGRTGCICIACSYTCRCAQDSGSALASNGRWLHATVGMVVSLPKHGRRRANWRKMHGTVEHRKQEKQRRKECIGLTLHRHRNVSEIPTGP
ncbi:hypothetical protein BDW72DRAFT_24035 [Aspergillus terricola var. indicus]